MLVGNVYSGIIALDPETLILPIDWLPEKQG
jgi:hypothetical protein